MLDGLLLYLILYLATILEGELAAMSGAFAAQQGFVKLTGVFVAIFLGTLTIDWLSYFSGRFLGRKIFDYFPKFKTKVAKTEQWIHNNASWGLLLYRFLYGFRILSLILFGINKVPLRKFIPYTIFIVFVWSLLFSILGYFLGEMMNEFFDLKNSDFFQRLHELS